MDDTKGVGATYGSEGMKSMLNLIGSAEASGDYNLVFGQRGKVPVTDMTVDEVLFHQNDMKSSGSPSTAVGRYQFLQKTLKSVKKEMGLSGDEKMSPELQDRMAVHLMRRRGLDSYLRGEIDQTHFVNRLAQEWAGLPTTSGQSYYAGDGLNRSNVALADVMSAVAGLASVTSDVASSD